MSNSVYQRVTDEIIRQLESGAMPWIKPWKADSTADKNIISQKPYSGINRLILGMEGMLKGYETPVWASFKQWQGLGATVRKGERGAMIVYYQPKVIGKDKEGNESMYMLLKSYFVFNVSQCDGIEIRPELIETLDFVASDEAEKRIALTGANISHGSDAAFYSPGNDRIQLPNKATFDNPESYYATAFHELTHWTGSKSRCDRNLSGKYGNPAYAFEELVAEMGAAFLCQDYKIQGEMRHAGYIKNWLKACKDDNKAIFKAAALAQKAADYVNALNVELKIAA